MSQLQAAENVRREEPDEMDAKNGKKELKTLQNELHQEISSQYTKTTNVHNTA